jgi:hypothetical protein
MALELLADEEPDAVRAATARLGSAYLALARYADARLAPGRGQDSGVEEVGHPSDLRPRDLVGQSPWRWFQEELPGIVAAVRQCHAAGLWSLTWQLADSVTGYLEASAAWPEWEIVTELALDAARQAGDPGAEATVLCSQGALAWQRRELDRASVCFAEARQRARQVGDRRLDSRSLIGLADVTLDRGMSNRARSMYAVAAGRCGSADDLRGLADALRGWAFAELWRGRAGAAVNRSTECYRVATRLGDRRWSEFARRLVERMRSGAARGGVAEVRPGVWLFGPRPTGAQPPDRDGDPAKSSLALVR